MKKPPILHSPPAFFAVIVALFLASASAWGASAESNIFTLDTRGTGSLTVTGRILDGATGLPLSGAEVALAGHSSVTTGGAGTFELRNVVATPDTPLSVAKSGYRSTSITVSHQAGQARVDLGDIRLRPPTDTPVVEWVRSDPTGLFLQGWGITLNATAQVDWNGHPAGSVEFRANGSLVDSQSSAGPGYAASIEVDHWFTPSLFRGANKITVTALSAEGVASEPVEIEITVLPVPGTLGVFSGDPANLSRKENTLGLSIQFPPEPIKKTVELPLLGSFGGAFQAEGNFRYGLTSGSWELGLGGKNSKAKVLLGRFDAGAGISATGRGTATLADGITFDGLSLGASLSLGGSFDLARIGILDLLGPGASTSLSLIPGLGKALDAVSIVLELKPSLAGSAEFDILPKFSFSQSELTGRLALNAAYRPDIKIVKVRLYAGGEPRIAFQVPGDLFREVGFRAYAGIEVSSLIYSFPTFEYVFVDYSYASAGRRLPLSGVHDLGNGYLLEAAGNATAEWQPMRRSWREAGPERFLLGEPEPGRRLDIKSAAAREGLDVFRRMGAASTAGAIHTPPQTSPMRRIASDPDLPAQAELPMLENVFPDADPAMAGRGDQLMLLYTRDSGADNPVQFTEVAWTFFDGSEWSEPVAVSPDPRGQFSPQVAFDGDGDAIAVFERIKDPDFSGTDPEELAALIEVVWSRWDNATQEWSAPTALSNDDFLNHRPLVAGPLANGDLLAAWTQNEANELQGGGEPGDPSNSRILTARWASNSKSWSAPEVLVDGLIAELSGSLAAAGDKAVYIWSRDMADASEEDSDGELFFREYDAVSGLWGPVVRHTDDAIHDRNALVALDASGDAYAVWQRGSELVMDVNFSGEPMVAREDTDTLGFSDFALTVGPGGNVLLIWQEMSEFGPNAHYRVYDPASGTWSLDAFLSQDEDLESSFAPVWDAMGNLTLAYLNTEITRETMSVEVVGGDIIEVEGVPQPGRVDLLVAKRALIVDLAIDPDGLWAEGVDFLPGDEITITTKVRNAGNVAVEDPVLSLFIGDPDEDGELIHESTVSGWLKAGDTAAVVFDWTVPEPAIARTLYAVVDAAGAVTEFDEENNVQWLHLNGIDLDLEYVSGSVLPDGSVRVIARVTNRGAPASPATRLDLWPLHQPGDSPLTSVDVSSLSPGASVELAVELPPGSHAEGEALYRLVVDADDLAEDINPANNEVQFALSLWIDDDNTPPTVLSAEVTPANSETNWHTDIYTVGNVEYIDPDGDPVTIHYQWYSGGTNRTEADPVPGAADSTFRPADYGLTRYDTFFCAVRGHDGEEYGSFFDTNAIFLNNAPPVFTSVPESLTFTAGEAYHIGPIEVEDPEGDAVTLHFGGWTTTQSGTIPADAAGGTFSVTVRAESWFDPAFESEPPFTEVTIPVTVVSLEYAISVAVAGETGGSVSGGGIYRDGETVSLLATSAEGHHFVHWMDGGEIVSTDPAYSFTATGPRSLTAHFALKQYTLRYAAGANGSIAGEAEQTVEHGSDGSAVEAVAAAHHRFVRWSDGSTANPRTDPGVTDDIDVTAEFALNHYTITTLASGGGVIEPENPEVAHDEDIELLFNPDEGHHVADVRLDGASLGAMDSLLLETVSGPMTVEVDFARNRYAITVTVSGEGSVTPGDAEVEHGGSVTLHFHPVEGYFVAGVWKDDEHLGAMDVLELTGVSGPYEIEVFFRANQFAQWADSLPEGQRGPFATPHNDNVTNVMRYTFGVGPHDAVIDRMPRHIRGQPGGSFAPQGGGAESRPGLEFWRRKDAEDIRVGIQFSGDLHHWLPTHDVDDLEYEVIEDDGTSERLRIWVPSGHDDGTHFIRLKIDWLGDGLIFVEGGTLPELSSLGELNVDSFYLGRFEVTWGEWKTVRDWAVQNGYPDLVDVGAGCGLNHPVHSVNWFDAAKWCNARSEMRGRTPVYWTGGAVYREGEVDPESDADADGYRLPTEAEWEFAARGGLQSQGFTYSGGDTLADVAWYNATSRGALCPLNGDRGTWPVGEKRANELGFHDMSGGVWEWIWEEHEGHRLVRGGGWMNLAEECELAYRGYYYADDSNPYTGFRVARRAPGEFEGVAAIEISGNGDFGATDFMLENSRTLTIHNAGTEPLEVNGINVASGAPFPVAVSMGWTGVIGAGDSVDVGVLVKPLILGQYSGSLRIQSNALAGTDVISFSGHAHTDPCIFWTRRCGAGNCPVCFSGTPSMILRKDGICGTTTNRSSTRKEPTGILAVQCPSGIHQGYTEA